MRLQKRSCARHRDVYAEGNESLTITLSNASGATLGSPNAVPINITDNDASTGTNPINIAAFFVRLHYIDFFTREPDADGLAFWADQITSCGTDQACREIRRINVSAALLPFHKFHTTVISSSGSTDASGKAPVPLRLR